MTFKGLSVTRIKWHTQMLNFRCQLSYDHWSAQARSPTDWLKQHHFNNVCQSLFSHHRFRRTFTTRKLIQTTKITKITGDFCVNFVVRSPSNIWTCAQNQRPNWLLLGSNNLQAKQVMFSKLAIARLPWYSSQVSLEKALKPVHNACLERLRPAALRMWRLIVINYSCWNHVAWLNTSWSVKP